jgi:hypothetical protein
MHGRDRLDALGVRHHIVSVAGGGRAPRENRIDFLARLRNQALLPPLLDAAGTPRAFDYVVGGGWWVGGSRNVKAGLTYSGTRGARPGPARPERG